MLKKTLCVIFITLIIPCTILAQTHRWVYTYNGSGNMVDDTYDVVCDSSGNIYAAGYSYESGTLADWRVVSFTPAGDTNWTYQYAASGSYTDQAYAITIGNDNNIYVTGRSTSSTRFRVACVDMTGAQKWMYSLWPGLANESVYGLDDNIYIAGRSTVGGIDFGVVSIDTTGTERWVYQYNGPFNEDDEAKVITAGADGNIYAAGFCTDTGFVTNALVISLTSSGDTNWTYTYDGGGVFDQSVNDIVFGPDGNIYIAGTSSDSITLMNFMVASLDTTGTVRWIYNFDRYGFHDYANAIVYGQDGNIYTAGTSMNSLGSYQFTVMSLTTNGDSNWVYTTGASNAALCIKYAVDNYVYAGGDDGFHIACLTNTGSENWFYTYEAPGGGWCRAITSGPDTIVYAVGASIPVAPWSDYTVISMFNDTEIPTAPQLISPVDNAYINDTIVSCVWYQAQDSVTGIKEYVFQYALDSFFTTPDSIIMPDTFIINIFAETTYYWRVKAVDSASNQSGWSETWSFEIDISVPQAPVLISPINGTLFVDTTITFEWTQTTLIKSNDFSFSKNKSHQSLFAAPVQYIIQLDTNTSFTSPVVIDTADTHSITLNISENYYYWHVKAFDLAGNESPYSTPDSFGVDISPPVIESTTVWPDTSYEGPFTIFTKVTDNLAGVDSVLMHYRFSNYPTWIVTAMNYTGSPGWYIDSIPQTGSPDDTVQYFIRAKDMLYNESTDPDGAPANNYSFLANWTSIFENTVLPKELTFDILENPSRNRVCFGLALPSNAEVMLKVYDIVGRLVGTPISGKLSAGYHNLAWHVPAAGVYFYRLETPWKNITGKVVLLD